MRSAPLGVCKGSQPHGELSGSVEESAVDCVWTAKNDGEMVRADRRTKGLGFDLSLWDALDEEMS